MPDNPGVSRISCNPNTKFLIPFSPPVTIKQWRYSSPPKFLFKFRIWRIAQSFARASKVRSRSELPVFDVMRDQRTLLERKVSPDITALKEHWYKSRPIRLFRGPPKTALVLQVIYEMKAYRNDSNLSIIFRVLNN